MRARRWVWAGVLAGAAALAADAVDDEILKDLDFYSMVDAVDDVSLLENAEASEAALQGEEAVDEDK